VIPLLRFPVRMALDVLDFIGAARATWRYYRTNGQAEGVDRW
jgi:hypothetical protein